MCVQACTLDECALDECTLDECVRVYNCSCQTHCWRHACIPTSLMSSKWVAVVKSLVLLYFVCVSLQSKFTCYVLSEWHVMCRFWYNGRYPMFRFLDRKSPMSNSDTDVPPAEWPVPPLLVPSSSSSTSTGLRSLCRWQRHGSCCYVGAVSPKP